MSMITGTATRTDPRAGRAQAGFRSPVREANAGRNVTGADRERHRRWRPARAALWEVLDPLLAPGARVAVVGAGNGDTVPLRELVARCARVDLIDLDPGALGRARRRCGLRARRSVRIVEQDVTGGAADRIVRLAQAPQADAAGAIAAVALAPATAIGEGPYDMVIGDLFFSQMLYPALVDAGLPSALIDRVLLGSGQPLTDAVVERLFAATAPGGHVVCVHDELGWWDGHRQPFPLEAVLELASSDPAAAATLVAQGRVPYGCDPHRNAGCGTQAAWWRWPFATGTDYLVRVTVRRAAAPTSDPRINMC